MNRFLPHRCFFLLLCIILFATLAWAQVQLKSVKALPSSDEQQVEIITSAPVVPAIQQLDAPPRLVVDLPNTRVQGKPQRIAVHSNAIKTIRVDEHQDAPPIARVVVDLAAPAAYKTESNGNRLLVRVLRELPTPTRSVAVRHVAASSVADPMTFSGNPVAPGSSLSAGSDTAILHVGGGEVRICPGTTVSVTPSPNGRDRLLGMNQGTLEAHYALPASSDSVLTPDFRILLAGPGQFDFAISADARGNTCVRALPGDNASVIVTELMGDQTYQVRPSEQVLFRSGRISDVETKVPPTCRCREPVAPVAVTGPESKPLPPTKPNDIHVTVDAPFVFNGNQAPAAPIPAMQGPTRRETEDLPIDNRSQPFALPDEVSPPPTAMGSATSKPSSQGFFTRVRKFFGSIFR